MGYAWVQYKVEKYNDEGIKLDPIPAVIGPSDDGKIYFYIVDDHHSLSALDFIGSDGASITVTLDVICDLRNEKIQHFWNYLTRNNLAYLGAHPNDDPNALPTKLESYKEIPTSFSFPKTGKKELLDDPWRSLAGFSRKVKDDKCDKKEKYCLRCMIRDCNADGGGISYFEFRWGYFMQDATYSADKHGYWPTTQQKKDFEDAFNKALVTVTKKGKKYQEYDLTLWEKAAKLIVPLCRSQYAAEYQLPTDIYPPVRKLPGNLNRLPGYTKGDKKLENDPECNSPKCPAADCSDNQTCANN